MHPSQQQQPRINLTDLKAQIVKKLGHERSKRYFYYLNGLLSEKLSKGEFNKLCFLTIGRENLQLHNLLIRSILKNACHAKVPPPIHEKEVPPKFSESIGKKSSSVEDGYQKNGPSPTSTSGPTPLIWSNGDVLLMSPRKIRSGFRDRRTKDRPSPLGPNGKTDFTSHLSNSPKVGNIKGITENGDLNSYDFQRLGQQHQGIAEQPDSERDTSLQRPMKRPRTKRSPDEPVSVHSKGPAEVVIVEDGEKLELGNNSNSARSPLRAPLGIPFCSASVGGARRVLPSISSSSSSSSSFAIASESGELPNTETLRKRMEHIVRGQGVEGVLTDCANVLNNGLDAYLKRLIRSCMEIVGARLGHEPRKQPLHKQQPHGKVINGILPGHQLQMQTNMQEQRTHCPISLLDFKTAMELNPQQLGEDWSLLLEKICMHACEE